MIGTIEKIPATTEFDELELDRPEHIPVLAKEIAGILLRQNEKPILVNDRSVCAVCSKILKDTLKPLGKFKVFVGYADMDYREVSEDNKNIDRYLMIGIGFEGMNVLKCAPYMELKAGTEFQPQRANIDEMREILINIFVDIHRETPEYYKRLAQSSH